MYHWIRMSPTIASSFFKPKVSLFDKTEIKSSAWVSDALVSIMNNSIYLMILEAGRVDLMIRSGIYKKLIKEGILPVSSAININYIRPIPRGQHFNITTLLSYFDDETIYLEQKIEHEGKIAAEAFVSVVCLGSQGKRTKVSPKDLFKLAGILEIPQLEKPWFVPKMQALRKSKYPS